MTNQIRKAVVRLDRLANTARRNLWPNNQRVNAQVIGSLVDRCAAGISDRDLAFVFTSFAETVLRSAVNHPRFPRETAVRLAVFGCRAAFERICVNDVNNVPYSDLIRLSASRDPLIRRKVEHFRRSVVSLAEQIVEGAKRAGGAGDGDIAYLIAELLKSSLPERSALIYEIRQLAPVLARRLPDELC
ncbi:MAG: hypothetical protein MUC35_01055 [Candidatus Margulisbacteria bacterium]|nr:hypothetical protein [Candidatus Margulisiibacteriota bacterium]